MAMFLPVLVCLSGGLGASCRYLLDTTVKTYWTRAFPMSTFVINLLAGLLAGLVAAAALVGGLDESWRLMLATGFLGGFSTFSTAINEMVTLFRKRRYPTAAGYLLASVVAPPLAAAAGFMLVA
ncbi:fluoride efflux transporter FluC [Bifidobacterium stellenboschense]|uniref:Fluoride-specific ion channel FluC n=1 Tax=Bifidobacterium stellenboschense TaxID=762211 RepID=A0A087DPW7_9BIFI|nr:CrcB family protein [Bifidobacterium stellenboschense]KFI97567.1 chromosome condensation protein CcrB [Bifidobacterium stellenboschense]